MKMHKVTCRQHNLYVVEAIPESDSLMLSSNGGKAYVGQKIDADICRDFASEKTGLEFVLEEC